MNIFVMTWNYTIRFSNLVGLIVFNSISGGALFLKHLTDTLIDTG